MIICVCKAVSDRHIRAAVADGVTSLRELTHELRVGTCCGKCLPEAKATLVACLDNREARAQRSVNVGIGAVQGGLFAASTPEFAT